MNLEAYLQSVRQDSEARVIQLDLQPFLSLANHVLELRLRYGLSQSEFAHRVGLKLSNIEKLEAGLSNPTLSQIHTIARKFNLRAGDLIKEE